MPIKKRNTPAKQMIRQAIEGAATAMSQDMLEEQLQGKADRVTIYRVLAGFCDDGILHRVVSDDGKAYYAVCKGCTGDQHRHQHAHFRCTSCQKVECLPANVKPRLPEGYLLHNMNYWMSGLCRNCG